MHLVVDFTVIIFVGVSSCSRSVDFSHVLRAVLFGFVEFALSRLQSLAAQQLTFVCSVISNYIG